MLASFVSPYDLIDPGERWDREERRLLTAQRIFSAEIARRVRTLREGRNTAVSPFSNLPVELQVPIFTEALKWSSLSFLSAVESRWQAVIEGTPQFWSSIDINKSEENLTRRLKLSSDAPLTISGGNGDSKRSRRALQRSVTLLQPHAYRIRHLMLKTRCVAELRPLLQSYFPQLEFLKIENTAARAVEVLLGDIPKLRVLEARLISLSSFYKAMPLLRVVRLGDVTNVSIKDVLDFLQRNPELEEIGLDQISSNDPTTDLPMVPLPRLKALRCHSTASHVTSAILSLVQTDILEKLIIEDSSAYLPTQLLSVLRSTLLTGFIRNSKWEHMHVHLGMSPGAWPTISFKGTSRVGQETKMPFIGRVDSPDELLMVVQAVRGLIEARCRVSIMEVRWIWPDWTSHQLQDLSDLLDVRSFHFMAANTWNQLLGTSPFLWPNLEAVYFPTHTIDGRPDHARLAAETLKEVRGGVTTVIWDGIRTQCYWTKNEVKPM